MALSDLDRNLLERCLGSKPRAWEDFVDRFMGLVVHVINHTATCRSVRLSTADREDLAADVFFAFVDNHMAVLRHFRRECSLATYLTVVARRVVVRKMVEGRRATPLSEMVEEAAADSFEQRIVDREQVEQLLSGLDEPEARVVRMYHLEGRTYDEISRTEGMPSGSIGPVLTRARSKMRSRGPDRQSRGQADRSRV